MTERYKLIEEAFTNKLGEVINVGDIVIIVTTCAHSVNVNKGAFLGFYETRGWNGKKEVRCVVGVDDEHEFRVHKTTGRKFRNLWSIPDSLEPTAEQLGVEDPGPSPQPSYSVWALPPAERAAYEVKRREHEEKSRKFYTARHAWLEKEFPPQKEKFVRRTVLQKNKIFKSADSLVGKRL